MTDIATLSIKVDATGATRAVDQFGRTVEVASKKAEYFTDAQGRLRHASGRFATEAEKAAVATQRMGAAMGTASTKATTLSASASAVGTAIGVLGGLVITQAIARIGQLGRDAIATADQMRVLEGRLKLVTGSAEELANVQVALERSAFATRTAYADVVQLYARVSQATEGMALSQDKLLRFTELTNLAIRAGGSTGASAAAGLQQFAQGLAAGAMRGEEFNSVVENTPGLARALVDGLGFQTIGQLRAFANEGKLATGLMIDAILRMEEEIRGDAAQAPLTVATGWQQLKDAISLTVGEIDKATGASNRFAETLQDIAGFIRNSASLPNNFARGLGAFAGMGRGGAPTGSPTGGPTGPSNAAPWNIVASPLPSASRATPSAAELEAARLAVKRLDDELRQLSIASDIAGNGIAKAAPTLKQFFVDLERNAAEVAEKLERGNVDAIKGTQGGEVARVFTEQMQTAIGRSASEFLRVGTASIANVWQVFAQLGRDAIGQVFAKSVMERLGGNVGKRLDGLIAGVPTGALGVLGAATGIVGVLTALSNRTSKWEKAAETINQAARSLAESARLQIDWRDRFLDFSGGETPLERELRGIGRARTSLAEQAFANFNLTNGSRPDLNLTALLGASGGSFDGLLGTLKNYADNFGGIYVTLYEQIFDLNEAYKRNTEAVSLNAEAERQAMLQQRADALAAFSDSLALSGQSPLSPSQRLAEARRQYEAIVGLASGGDQSALDSLPEAARALLEASRAVNASGIRYAEDYTRVRADVDRLISLTRLAATAGPTGGLDLPPSTGLPNSVVEVNAILTRSTVLAEESLAEQVALGNSIKAQTNVLQAGFLAMVEELVRVKDEVVALRSTTRNGFELLAEAV